MLNIGPPELILIFVIALVIVGPQRLPELGRTIGKGLREFRRMQDEVKDLVNTGMGEEFKETAAELKRTASDLKSAADVRSAFRDDEPRSRPRAHRRRPAITDGEVTPEPDQPGPDEPRPTELVDDVSPNGDAPGTPEAGAGLDPPPGQDGASLPGAAEDDRAADG
jgi:Tat protein translocase TatB subunit